MSCGGATKGRRLTIGIFGRVNSGKSSLLNYLADQALAIVSATPGTTTDSVEKAMELPDIGACLFIDTPGLADETELGALRQKATAAAVGRADIALVLFAEGECEAELALCQKLMAAETPLLPVISRIDELADGGKSLAAAIERRFDQAGIAHLPLCCASAKEKTGRAEIFAAIRNLAPDIMAVSNAPLTNGLCAAGDTVLLVMPQDIEAPVGRLILPQVETIRELLDKKCVVIASTADQYAAALAALKEPPKLIITDSQAFAAVYQGKPKESLLTSFSILLAAQKGDIDYFTASAKKILQGELKPGAKILIAEACSHIPLHEDIGRVKIPALLKKRFGDGLDISFVNGRDFPLKLTDYDLIIHCGACMFNRKLVMSRVAAAKAEGVPMTNYGITIATLTGIIDKVSLPKKLK